MKTKIKTISLTLFLSFFLFNVSHGDCTNFLVTKGASKDGSTMITYAADSHVLYGELYYRAAADHPEGAMLDVYEWDTGKYLGKIPQVDHTYSVVGNMNEHQLSIGETHTAPLSFGPFPIISRIQTSFGSAIENDSPVL